MNSNGNNSPTFNQKRFEELNKEGFEQLNDEQNSQHEQESQQKSNFDSITGTIEQNDTLDSDSDQVIDWMDSLSWGKVFEHEGKCQQPCIYSFFMRRSNDWTLTQQEQDLFDQLCQEFDMQVQDQVVDVTNLYMNPKICYRAQWWLKIQSMFVCSDCQLIWDEQNKNRQVKQDKKYLSCRVHAFTMATMCKFCIENDDASLTVWTSPKNSDSSWTNKFDDQLPKLPPMKIVGESSLLEHLDDKKDTPSFTTLRVSRITGSIPRKGLILVLVTDKDHLEQYVSQDELAIHDVLCVLTTPEKVADQAACAVIDFVHGGCERCDALDCFVSAISEGGEKDGVAV